MIRKAVFLLFLILPLTAGSAVHLMLEFADNTVNQGSIEEVKIQLNEEAIQNLELQKLSGQTIEETLYFHQISPVVKTDSGFSASAEVIFIKVPEKELVTSQIGSAEVAVTWGNVKIDPTEAAKDFMFGDFQIPGRKNLILWGSIVLALIVLSFLGLSIKKKIDASKAEKNRRKELKSNFFAAKSYEDIVLLWRNKELYLREFPHIKEAFPEFEKVLFRYQFKERQSESEKLEVVESYKKLLNRTEGGFNGI